MSTKPNILCPLLGNIFQVYICTHRQQRQQYSNILIVICQSSLSRVEDRKEGRKREIFFKLCYLIDKFCLTNVFKMNFNNRSCSFNVDFRVSAHNTNASKSESTKIRTLKKPGRCQNSQAQNQYERYPEAPTPFFSLSGFYHSEI